MKKSSDDEHVNSVCVSDTQWSYYVSSEQLDLYACLKILCGVFLNNVLTCFIINISVKVTVVT